MKIYKCQAQYYDTFKKNFYLRSVVLGLLLIAYMYYDVSHSGTDLIVLYVGVLAVIFGIATSLFSFLRRAKRIVTTYELVVEDEAITRRQYGVDELTLTRHEITEIQVVKKDLVLRTKETNRYLAIPRALEGFSEVEELLATWVPIKPYKMNTKDMVSPTVELIMTKFLLPLQLLLLTITALQTQTDKIFIFGGLALALGVIIFLILKKAPSLWNKYKTKIILFYLVMGTLTSLSLLIRP